MNQKVLNKKYKYYERIIKFNKRKYQWKKTQNIQLNVNGKDIALDIENAISEITYVYNEEIGI